MFFRVSSAVSIGRRWLAVTVLFSAAACTQPTVAPSETPSSRWWRTFVGGTGRYAGVTGEYSFEWRFILESEDGSVGGPAVNLKGRARLGSATAAPGGGQSQ